MAFHLAIANRKGGVGKSTVSVMLAYALSVWGGKRVLVIDVDSQSNSSMILIGGQGWFDARTSRRTIADYLADHFRGHEPFPQDYIIDHVGEVCDSTGGFPELSLLTGSLLIDDVQGDAFLALAERRSVFDISTELRSSVRTLLRNFDSDFDVVILDCAPGLSFSTLAALEAADRVIVPFRPDYVSLLAVDRVSLVIENQPNLDALSRIPLKDRRYICLPNCVRESGRERLLIEETGLGHPLMHTLMPHHDQIASSFDWLGKRLTIEKKYGRAIGDVQKLYEEVCSVMEQPSGNRVNDKTYPATQRPAT